MRRLDSRNRLAVALVCSVALLFCGHALAQVSAESAAASYADETRDTEVASTSVSFARNFLKRRGTATSFSLSHTYKHLRFKSTDDLSVTQQLGGRTNVDENNWGLSLSQGLGVGTNLGLFAGYGDSPLSESRYFGGRIGQWWLQETLQTVVEARRTEADVPPVDVTDVDVRRIVTPDKIAGNNMSFSVTHLTTPSTILMSSFSRTYRSDRPPADAVSGEIRQFVDDTNSAMHIGYAHYENIGQIKPITLYGTVVSNAGYFEWHQRVYHLIAMAGYRHYREQENPRASEAPRTQLASDWYYGSLRYRLGEGAWTDEQHEVYLFGGRYITNIPNAARIIGLGVKLSF